MSKVVDYYMENEWIRWIIFIPLIFILNALLVVFVHVVNIGFTDSWLFQFLVIPGIGATATIGLTLALSPRWHSGFCWLWIALIALAFAAGVFNILMQVEGNSYSDVIQSGVWVTCAIIAKKYFGERK